MRTITVDAQSNGVRWMKDLELPTAIPIPVPERAGGIKRDTVYSDSEQPHCKRHWLFGNSRDNGHL
jgi:hypothetical protein